MKLKHFIIYLISFQFLFIIIACGNDNENPANEMLIDATGGTITKGDVTLVIPEGAVEEAINISINPVDLPQNSNFVNAGNFYRIGPDNQQFLKDVTITMNYKPHILPADLSESEITIWTAKEYSFSWQSMPSTLDKQNFTVSTTTNHFSLFGPAITYAGEDGDLDNEQSEDENSGTPAIYTEDIFDFGPIALNTTSKQNIMISNNGDATLIISESLLIGSDSTVFSITNPGKIYIEPNYKQGIEISFTPEEVKDYSVTLIIDSNDPEDQRTTVKILGKGKQ